MMTLEAVRWKLWDGTHDLCQQLMALEPIAKRDGWTCLSNLVSDAALEALAATSACCAAGERDERLPAETITTAACCFTRLERLVQSAERSKRLPSGDVERLLAQIKDLSSMLLVVGALARIDPALIHNPAKHVRSEGTAW